MTSSALRRLDLNLLLVLHTVLETRNVTLAAERLHMSQPAVSRSLARLRDVFDDPLFIKGAGGVIATPRAEALSSSVAGLLSSIDAVVGGGKFDPTTTDRVFRIATTDYGALALLPRIVEILADTAPICGIEVVPFAGDVFRRLSAGDVDIVLYSDDPVPDGLRTHALFKETYTSLVRTGHQLIVTGDPASVSLDDFLQFPHILVSLFGGRTGVIDDALTKIGRRRKIAVWLPYFATAAVIAAQTDLILTLPTQATRRLAVPHGLTAFTPPFEIEGYGYQLVWHERTNHDPGSVWLRQRFVDAARNMVS
jgi:DNA-binding transcriptional LysR family regulator